MTAKMLTTNEEDGANLPIQVSVPISVVAGLFLLYWIICCCRHIPQNDVYGTGTDFSISPKVFWEELKLDEMALDEATKEKVRLILIQRDKLTIHKLIGEGQYAQVHFGTLLCPQFQNEQKVAVKIMKETWTGQARNLIEEGMLTIDFNHPNVLTIIGISLEFIHVKQIKPLVVMPFMENGDLNSFLKHTRVNNSQQLTLSMCIEMMVQIASGMEYISGRKIVHRDLATRNCMLDDNFTVKVADFGLARRMHDAEFYKMNTTHQSQGHHSNCMIPVRWVAIEGLSDSIFTTKSDVWSFGITMWEIITHAKIPYAGLANYDILQHLESGHRLQQPDGCPAALYNLMFSCWSAVPTLRPSFTNLKECLEGLRGTIGHQDACSSPSIARDQRRAETQQYNPLYDSCWV